MLQDRVQRYEESEIRFNLMVLTQDKRALLGDQLNELQARKMAAEIKLASLSAAEGESVELMESDVEGIPDTKEELESLLTRVAHEISSIEESLHAEDAKFARYHVRLLLVFSVCSSCSFPPSRRMCSISD